MPELPEVETVRLSLVHSLIDKEIVGVRFGAFTGVVGDIDIAHFVARVQGQSFTDLRRRGKYLIADLTDGTSLLVHLRMTGSLMMVPESTEPLRFEHLAIVLNDGFELRFADQRKFGRILHLDHTSIQALDARLGPEPLADEFDANVLVGALRKRTGKIKSVLLNQQVVAGLGNIYVDEALFRAGIHPLRTANELSEVDAEQLHAAIRFVLLEGLHNRGTSFSSFRDGYGASGDNQNNLRVYGRGDKGLPCHGCGQPLRRLKIGGRSSHFCPICQPFLSIETDKGRIDSEPRITED